MPGSTKGVEGWRGWAFLFCFFLSELRGRTGMEGEGERLQGAEAEQGGGRWCRATSSPGLERGGGP